MARAQYHLELENRVSAVAANQNVYRPTDKALRHRIAQVSLGLMVGPTAIGKSHMIQVVQNLDPGFVEINTVTTRPRAPRDPPGWRTDQPFEELLSHIENGTVGQYTVHPSTGHIYATDIASYEAGLVLLPTLYSAVEQLKNIGFRRVITIGLVAEGKTWDIRLSDRRNDPQYPERLVEGRESVHWLRAHMRETPILENATGQDQQTAQTIISLMKESYPPQLIGRTGRINRLCIELLEVIGSEERVLNVATNGKPA
jgi:hypothetical protein